MSKLQVAIMVAWENFGKPYRWGGDDPVAGFDCSGFVIEILKSVGILPRGGDWTAQMLFDKFKDKATQTPKAGCLVFWYNRARSKIVHVEFLITSELAIGAGGGSSRTVTMDDAIAQNAYIKVRPFGSRSGVAGFVDPFQ